MAELGTAVQGCCRRRDSNVRRVILSGCLLAGMFGCSKPSERSAPAEGIVTLDGKPVAAAGVMFQPVAGGPSAFGTTDENGHFRLSTADRVGIRLGDFRVAINKSESLHLPRGPGVGSDDGELRKISEVETKYYLPPRYASPATSELRATIKPIGNNFTFSLTSDETITAPHNDIYQIELPAADDGQSTRTNMKKQ